MSTEKSWLDALKETIEEEPKPPGENLRKPTPATMQNVQKPREVSRSEVVDIRTARAAHRDPDERRLIAAGWTPKDNRGPLNLTIWADPETGFCYSREVALHRLDGHEAGTP